MNFNRLIQRLHLKPLGEWVLGLKRARKYIHGYGVEIGALHKPFKLTGLPVSKISYVDRMTNEDLRKQYPELNDLDLVEVDIVDDGSTLSRIPDESLDFIIANNLIEHLQNPIKTLENWHRKLRPGGIIYLAVPDKRYTFDIDRKITTIHHLVEDYRAGDEEIIRRNYSHFVETAEIIEKRTGKDAQDRVNDLISRNYSIHFHAWDFRSFKKFLGYIITEMKIQYTIVDHVISTPLTKEFVFILGKPISK
ncbi:MAG TPA: methyltransferase domain-containing protein [Anaerolinea sp.]|nr:methyltransferase domain-containing protein [Anaerolinea sp.]